MTIHDIFNTYRDRYIERFGDQMPVHHRKTISAVILRRSAHFGLTRYRCGKCKTAVDVPPLRSGSDTLCR